MSICKQAILIFLLRVIVQLFTTTQVKQKNYIPLATNAVRQGMLVGRNLTEQKNWLIVAHRELLVYIYSVGKIGSTGVTKESAKLNGLDVEATVFRR